MTTQYYKHPEFGNVYGIPVLFPTCRCTWVKLVTPEEAPPAKPGQVQGAPRFSVTMLLPKEEKTTKEFIKVITAMVTEMLPLFNQGRKAKLNIDSILVDGDTQDTEKYPFYKGCWALIARNVNRPQIVDGKKSELPPEAIMGGMFVRGTITPLLTGHGVSYKLLAIMKVKDDEVRFGGAARAGSYIDMIPAVEDDTAEETTALAEEPETPAKGKSGSKPQTAEQGKAKALSML